MEKQFKSLILQVLFFTLLTQFLSVFVTYRFSFSLLAEEVYEPFGKTIEGAVANSIPILVYIFIFGFFIAFLVRFRKFDFVKGLLTAILASSVFSLNFILFSTIFPGSNYLTWIISGLLVLLVFLVAYVKRFRFLSRFLSLFIGAEAGGYFATILRPPTVFVLPLILAAYDIYAVFAGPLKRIVGKPPKSGKLSKKPRLDFLSLLIVDFNFVKIGLGDIAFYSMLPATAFILSGLQKMLLTIFATNLGVALTLYLLMKKKIALPGLPIPMLLGILALIL